jgi:hypothetical protein
MSYYVLSGKKGLIQYWMKLTEKMEIMTMSLTALIYGRKVRALDLLVGIVLI